MAWYNEKIKSLENSDDLADQITGGKDDNTPGFLEQIYSWNICLYYVHNVHNKAKCSWFYYERNISLFIFSEHYDFLSHLTEKYLFKVKSINIILICYCGQSQQ